MGSHERLISALGHSRCRSGSIPLHSANAHDRDQRLRREWLASEFAADAGELTTETQTGAQIDRMLADPRADTLLDAFAGQWLDYRQLETHEVASVDAGAEQLTRIDTSALPRVGLLTLGAFLTKTSFSSRTSPVKRGDLVYTHLLCGTIPPPPPDLPSLPEGVDNLTLRERLEEHRKNPSRAAPHNVMDPLGFGLKNYDALGAHRPADGRTRIDASGTRPDRASFNGA